MVWSGYAILMSGKTDSIKLNNNPGSTFVYSEVFKLDLSSASLHSYLGLEVGLIRRIQGIGYDILEFLGVETTFDIFQNIHILYLQYGILTSSGYGVLIFFPMWSLEIPQLKLILDYLLLLIPYPHNKDLSDLLKDTRYAFFTLDSPQDEPIIDSDKSKEEEEVAKYKDTRASSHDVPEDTSIPYPPSLKSAQIQDCLPTELKDLPSKFTELSGKIKELKQHVKEMEIELPGDSKKIPTKLETFTSTISSLTSQVAELKKIQWELPADFQALPVLVSSVQMQLKTLDSLPSLLNKVTETFNMFATVVENALGAMAKDVPSTSQATASPAEEEKNTTKDAETNLQNELVDFLGIDVVEKYHNKKLLFDKYCDKMLKRRKSSKIINCDVITQKGPISLKVYREDGTIKVIANFKVSDLHLAEWRKVVQSCPDRK
ncbi:hypothetical protein Tco_0343106 [Tanacetum coccineum]